MPKKHAPTYTQTKPSYVHPSLQSSRSASSSSPAPPQTVTERIQQLRREQTPRASSSRRDEVTEIVSSRTLPKQLRQVLGSAEVDAPPPKPGNRSARTPRRGARPPPGPAAPGSWLQTSRHAPPHIRNLKKYRTGGGMGPVRFCALAQVHDEEFKRLPPRRSLVHHCLRTLATHWEDLVEYEQHYLPALPIPLKEVLLSYLSIYGARGCLDMRSLKILFGNSPEVEGDSGADEIRFLDLTGLLSQNYTLSELNKCLARPVNAAAVTSDLSSLSLENPVAESWEEEADTPSTATLPFTLSVPHFQNLTRLSLAHPGTSASWPALLSLSNNLKTLTHLSLAYWPIPSMTPNAGTTSMVSKHGGAVALGGSHFYSELDGDWHEAANILRRLSKNTYCLQWLDLEGCSWIQALTWEPEDTSLPGTPRRRERARQLARAILTDRDMGRDRGRGRGSQTEAAWEACTTAVGPDWNGAWRQVEYINMFQGWMPREAHRVQSMPAGFVNVQLLSWLREHIRDEAYEGKWGHGDVHEWVERERGNRSVGSEILTRRRVMEGKWVCVDHGWDVEVGVRRRKGDGDGEGDDEDE